MKFVINLAKYPNKVQKQGFYSKKASNYNNLVPIK